MPHDVPDVTLQSSLHEVALHGLREVTSERQVISHYPSVPSMVLMVQKIKGKHIINLLYYTTVDLCFGRHGVLLKSKLNHMDLHSASVNMKFTVQKHSSLLQHKSIIV